MFHGWENFYLVLGSAGAGLIGLLFVVVTLTSTFERSQAERGQRIYMTPTAVHFATVLTISAVAVAPGLSAQVMAAVVALAGVWGLWIAARACIGMRNAPPGSEPPHWSDFWMYGYAPAAMYLALSAAAVTVGLKAPYAAEVLAAVLLVLLLVGVRNAWDLVTFIAPMRNAAEQGKPPPADNPKPQATDSAE